MSRRCRRKSDHPMWSVLKLAIVCVPLSIFLFRNASHPDWTEGKSIIQLASVLGALEAIHQVAMRVFGRGGNQNADE